MRKFKRLPAPKFLVDNWEAWGKVWADKHANGGSFYWHEVGNEPVNQKLIPLLKTQTQAHCSFCDAFPVSPPSRDTIEHFRPKSRFPLVAYKWENLYYCCDYCQGKPADEFSEKILCPDEPGYDFDDYYRWDYTLGTLEINESVSAENQERARLTREFFKLNSGHPLCRKEEARNRSRRLDDPIDKFAYRDFVDSAPREPLV